MPAGHWLTARINCSSTWRKQKKVKVKVVSDSLRRHWLYSPWHSPGQNTGVGSLSLLQEISPTQWLNPGLLHCRQIIYQLSHKGSPRILEWVAYPFFSGSSQPRNQTGVSRIAGRFFTNHAIREPIIRFVPPSDSGSQGRPEDLKITLGKGRSFCTHIRGVFRNSSY